jgi:hypothetical protein
MEEYDDIGTLVYEDDNGQNVGDEPESYYGYDEPDEPEDGMSDAKADVDTLRCCGWGTDENYMGGVNISDDNWVCGTFDVNT